MAKNNEEDVKNYKTKIKAAKAAAIETAKKSGRYNQKYYDYINALPDDLGYGKFTGNGWGAMRGTDEQATVNEFLNHYLIQKVPKKEEFYSDEWKKQLEESNAAAANAPHNFNSAAGLQTSIISPANMARIDDDQKAAAAAAAAEEEKAAKEKAEEAAEFLKNFKKSTNTNPPTKKLLTREEWEESELYRGMDDKTKKKTKAQKLAGDILATIGGLGSDIVETVGAYKGKPVTDKPGAETVAERMKARREELERRYDEYRQGVQNFNDWARQRQFDWDNEMRARMLNFKESQINNYGNDNGGN